MTVQLSRGFNIFYVDDDEDDLCLFQNAAEELGHKVSVFNYAESLLDALLKAPPMPTVVFIDLNMPARNGYEIIADLKNSDNFNDLPIVVYSTSDNPNTITKCRRMGVDLYIPKPSKIKDISKVISHVAEIDWHAKTRKIKNFVLKV